MHDRTHTAGLLCFREQPCVVGTPRKQSCCYCIKHCMRLLMGGGGKRDWLLPHQPCRSRGLLPERRLVRCRRRGCSGWTLLLGTASFCSTPVYGTTAGRLALTTGGGMHHLLLVCGFTSSHRNQLSVQRSGTPGMASLPSPCMPVVALLSLIHI